MTKQALFFILLVIVAMSCSKEEMEPEMMDPDPLTVVRIDGFISTGGSTFQVTNLLNNPNSVNLQTISPFFVEFSKPVMDDWLRNNSLPKLLETENGEAVSGVTINFTYPSSREITIEPAQPLEPGTTYRLVINPGYTATDGGVMEEHATVNFTTVN